MTDNSVCQEQKNSFTHLKREPGEKSESKIILELSEDRLAAYITVKTFPTEAVVTKEDIVRTLKKEKIIYGIVEEAVQSAVNPENRGSPVLVAIGTPPVNGKDGVIHYKCQSGDLAGVPQQLSNGRIDYYNLNQIHCVGPGDVLAVIEDAFPGQQGCTVTGEVIPARDGKPVHIQPGKNVHLSKDNHELLATAAGHVIIRGDTVSVSPVYRVEGDVDFNTGNILFKGSVVITGNVSEGFRVIADGNVEIMNTISGGQVECSGELLVKNGIVGKNKSLIKAGGSIITRFIENAQVESGIDVIASEGIMHSKVNAVSCVRVTGKGVIVGGVVRAGEEISCRIAGSHLATATELEAGTNPGLRKEYSRLLKEKQSKEAHCLKSRQIFNYLKNIRLEKGKLSREQIDILVKVNKSHVGLTRELEKINDILHRIEALILRSEHGKINIEDIVHPGVKITLGSEVFFVRDDYRFVSFARGENGINISPLK